MAIEYINFQTEYACNHFQRRTFLNRWWSLGCDDPGWTPPRYVELFQHLVFARGAHAQRLSHKFLHQAAVRRQRGSNTWEMHTWMDSGGVGGASLDVSTSAAGILLDKRLEPGTAYLFSPHVINDAACVGRLFDALADACAELGIVRLVGPTSISPYLHSGMQLDYWHHFTPNLVASNPPYVPELLAQHMQPMDPILGLWHLPIPARSSILPDRVGLMFEPLEMPRLAGDLLPLMIAACESMPGFPPPDAPEAGFLLSQLPLGSQGWLAILAGQPVGFVALGPEISPALRRWRGGRNLADRLLLALSLRRPFHHGRIYFASVLPAFRRQGIGNHLLHQAVQVALAQGWPSLVCGPLADSAPSAALLAAAGAQLRTAYRFFELEW